MRSPRRLNLVGCSHIIISVVSGVLVLEAKRVEKLVLHRGEAAAEGADGELLPTRCHFPNI